jgi:hypothetical protein
VRQRQQQRQRNNPQGHNPRQGSNAGNRNGNGNGNRRGPHYLERLHKEQQRVTEPLTYKEIRKQTRAATNLKFRPLERKEGAELRASNRRVHEVGDWWNNYLDQINQGRSETQAAYSAADAASQAQMGQASAIDNANTQRLSEEAAKSAALRGAAPSNAPAEREAAAQAARNYLAGAESNTTRQLGANQFGYLTDQKRIGAGQSIASRKEEQRRGQSIRQDQKATAGERGEYAASKRGELRDKAVEEMVQKRAFGLERKKTSQEAKTARLEAQVAAEERGEKRHQQGIENRQKQRELSQEDKKIRNERGMTRSERNAAREGQHNANATAASLYKTGKGKNHEEWQSWEELEKFVRRESEVSPTEARKAVTRLKKKVQAEERQKNKQRQVEWEELHHSGL